MTVSKPSEEPRFSHFYQCAAQMFSQTCRKMRDDPVFQWGQNNRKIKELFTTYALTEEDRSAYKAGRKLLASFAKGDDYLALPACEQKEVGEGIIKFARAANHLFDAVAKDHASTDNTLELAKQLKCHADKLAHMVTLLSHAAMLEPLLMRKLGEGERLDALCTYINSDAWDERQKESVCRSLNKGFELFGDCRLTVNNLHEAKAILQKTLSSALPRMESALESAKNTEMGDNALLPERRPLQYFHFPHRDAAGLLAAQDYIQEIDHPYFNGAAIADYCAMQRKLDLCPENSEDRARLLVERTCQYNRLCSDERQKRLVSDFISDVFPKWRFTGAQARAESERNTVLEQWPDHLPAIVHCPVALAGVLFGDNELEQLLQRESFGNVRILNLTRPHLSDKAIEMLRGADLHRLQVLDLSEVECENLPYVCFSVPEMIALASANLQSLRLLRLPAHYAHEDEEDILQTLHNRQEIIHAFVFACRNAPQLEFIEIGGEMIDVRAFRREQLKQLDLAEQPANNLPLQWSLPNTLPLERTLSNALPLVPALPQTYAHLPLERIKAEAVVPHASPENALTTA